MRQIRLSCHPSTPCLHISNFLVDIDWGADGNLCLCYQANGDISQISIAPRQALGAADGLWQHTCCEAFVGIEHDRSYQEFNFSPSGQFAAYAFQGYRIRKQWTSDNIIPIDFSISNQCFQLTATVAAADLPVVVEGSIIELGISAVIESADGSLSYWAYHHASEVPDFHHRDSFTLALTNRTTL